MLDFIFGKKKEPLVPAKLKDGLLTFSGQATVLTEAPDGQLLTFDEGGLSTVHDRQNKSYRVKSLSIVPHRGSLDFVWPLSDDDFKTVSKHKPDGANAIYGRTSFKFTSKTMHDVLILEDRVAEIIFYMITFEPIR